MKKSNAKDLFLKHRLQTLNEQERATLESWYNEHGSTLPPTGLSQEQLEADLATILSKLPVNQGEVKPLYGINFFYKLTVAAVALILVTVGIGFYLRNSPKHEVAKKVNQEILPAGNKAILTLANNTQVVLDDLSVGELATQTGISITKSPDGKLIYTVLPTTTASGDDVQFNTISTPRGANYQVELSDGTVAWLNSSSSIKFPTRFTGDSRSVSITGEVYFEVAKSKNKTFQVNSGMQMIEVLGTHFNVDAHSKAEVVTTLIEGSIRVSAEKLPMAKVLVPGEQSIYNVDESSIKISKTNTEKSVSWKSGYFLFDNEDIRSIMAELSLWYNVDVSYSGSSKTNKKFSGDISRNKPLAQVLKVLEVSGNVKFELDGRRVKVML